jgi:hypothetical protein
VFINKNLQDLKKKKEKRKEKEKNPSFCSIG